MPITIAVQATRRRRSARSAAADRADLTLTLTKVQLLGLLGGTGLGSVATDGDTGVLRRLLGLLDAPDTDFAIVTP